MNWRIFGMNRVRATGAWAAGGICMASVLVGVTPDCRAQPCERSSWTRVAYQPVATALGQVAYDSDRGVLVWLNGTGTWESANGDIWSLRAESGPRNGGQIVYDEARHVCLLFGGFNYFGPDETWQWDGSTWTFMTNQGPPPRSGPSLAYDSINQRVLLFGGEAGAVRFNDTWAWSGSTWELIDSSLATPPPRSRAALSYDPQRGKMVLFGGNNLAYPFALSDTWEFDGTEWTQVASTGPAGRSSAGMAYDAARHLTVLYGGYVGVTGPVGDTWEWNGSQWSNPSASSPAGVRTYNGMVFNAGLGRVVSVGGMSSNTADPAARTWQWTGTTWAVAGMPEALPPGRWFSAMAYDSQRQRVVMYGGGPSAGSNLADTWEFDGTNWLRRSISGPPGPRENHSMAYDSVRGATVLFGGDSTNNTWVWDGASWSLASNAGPGALSGAPMDFDSDRGVCVLFRGDSAQPQTWEWDGAEWINSANSGPPLRYGAAMAYDADRHFSVLFGGMSIGGDFHDLSDLWGWNGLNWTALSTSPVPPGRHFHTLAYDSVRGKLVMFGGRIGRDVPPLRTLGDTWEFDGNHWTQAVVPGPSPRGGSCMAFDAARNQMVLFGGEFGLDDTWVYRFGAVGPDPTIGAQPESRSVPFGEGVSFAVLAQGGGELTYQWRKDTVALTDDSRIGGSSTATLVINPISSSDGGVYDVVVSNPCTSATSDPATLTVSSCPADFNLDGVQNTQDYFDFVNAFFASAPSADFDHSGVVDSSDFFAFLTAFFAGCGL